MKTILDYHEELTELLTKMNVCSKVIEIKTNRLDKADKSEKVLLLGSIEYAKKELTFMLEKYNTLSLEFTQNIELIINHSK